MRDPQIAIEKSLYDFITEEARRNGRTIKGQITIMLNREKEELEKVRSGKTQLTTPDFLDGPLNSGDGTYRP